MNVKSNKGRGMKAAPEVIKLAPHDLPAERYLIGTILIKNETLALVQDVLEPRDFYDQRNRLVFRAMLSLSAAGKPIDEITLGDALKAHGDDFEKVGDRAFLATLTEGMAAVGSVTHYAAIISEHSRRRILRQLGTEVAEKSCDGFTSDTIIRDIQRDLLKIESRRAQATEIRTGFEAIAGDLYRLSIPEAGIVFEIDRLRRDRHELIGELSVKCTLPGARTYDGALTIADFNLSSARARSERAKLLLDRSQAELDWTGFLEEFCQRVLAAERAGTPAIDLRELDRPAPDDTFQVEGLSLPRRHPTVIFGDGGAAKSYTALFIAGRLNQRGISVALFDWELAGEDHRDRLERLFGDFMPSILYARCERPLVHEVDRLKRIVAEKRIEYALYDSIAFACDGPPEAAEIASRYFRAARQIGAGSLHVAHVTKGEGSEDKPFGSVFWHNGARATWFAKIAEASPDGHVMSLGLFPRKANLGSLTRPTSFEISFDKNRTTFTRKDPSENPELAIKLSVHQRMIALLRRGAMSPDDLAKAIDVPKDTITKTVRRKEKIFVVLDSGKVALLQRVTS